MRQSWAEYEAEFGHPFYMETSAKTGKNVDAAVKRLNEIMIQNANDNPGDTASEILGVK